MSLSLRFKGLRGLFAKVVCAASLIALLALMGCSSSSTEGGKEAAKNETEKAGEKQPGEKKLAEPVKPDYAKLWSAQAAKAQHSIEAGKLDEAEAEVAALSKIYESAAATDKPSAEQLKQQADLTAGITAKRAELAAIEREELLASAKASFQKQDYNAASAAVSKLLAISPTPKQLEEGQAIRVEVERIAGRQRELRGLIRMLGSDDENNVRSAESQLAAEPDVALSLLIESVKSKDNPLLVRNILRMMRRMKRPDVSLPAMVGVLSNEEQKKSWEDAVLEISRMDEPGAGKPLLDLIMTSKNPEQRAAALQSLVSVVDPPAETQIALLPLVMQDGPELPQALRAVHRSVRVHGTYDAAAERNMEVEVTPDQAAQLAELPARLEKLMAAPTDAATTPEVAYEAKVLAMATRREEPQVLTGLKIYGFSFESDDSPAAAVLDGVWNTVDYKNQWRHPAAQQSSITIDLGEEKTVVGVRIWNFNEATFPHRGWKECDVFVSDKPRIFDPVATGIVPMAPAIADSPDYSTLIPVDFVRGRYVKLQAKSLWRADTHTGLAEVQVIGF